MPITAAPTPADPPTIPIFHSPLAEPFLVEWERLRRSTEVTRRVAAWDLPGGAIEVCEQRVLDLVLARTGFLGARRDDDAGDAALLAVVRMAAHDDLAARVALQRLLPALVATARRRGPISGGASAAFTELVATAWIVIRTYPVDRRPRKVASNIVRDAEYLAFVRPQRLKTGTEHVGLPPDELGPEARLDGGHPAAPTDPAEELRELVGLVPPPSDPAARAELAEDRALLAALADGADTSAVARRFSVSERTVRNRKRRAVLRLRDAARAAAA